MDSSHGKKKMNVEGDRLSNLPDDLIHKILSVVSNKQAIETSGLSSRWRYIWTSMPYLNLSTTDFHTLPDLSKFVTHLLSNRNNQSEVYSVNLSIQQLNITGLHSYMYPLADFPPSLFSSRSLKHLTLTGLINARYTSSTIPTWTMPALTTLKLHGVVFYDSKCIDLLSNATNLNNLTFKNCISLNSFTICHLGLSNLTFERGGGKCCNVVTPQLKNLTIKYWRGIHLVSTQNLSSLRYTDDSVSYRDNDVAPLQLHTELPHLETVDICIYRPTENKDYTRKTILLLQQLRSVKFLTLNLELVKFFSSVQLISHHTSPFVNLKSLKFYPVDVASEVQKHENVTISTEGKNYLLSSSPRATFTMVTHEEIRVVKNVISARNLLTELEDKLKEYFEINMTDIEQVKDLTKSHMATGRKIQEMLPTIDALLNMLPISHWYKLQKRLSAMCADFNTINQRDNKFHES